MTWAGLQAEKERRRILQRLKEGRQARTSPHQPCWFTFHPEVTALPASCHLSSHAAAEQLVGHEGRVRDACQDPSAANDMLHMVVQARPSCGAPCDA